MRSAPFVVGAEHEFISRNRDHLFESMLARCAHAVRFDIRDHQHFHHGRDGVHLFHRSFQAIAREYWLEQYGAGWLTNGFLAFVALVFPDLQAFNLVDDIVAGAAIRAGLFLKTALSRPALHVGLRAAGDLCVLRQGTMKRVGVDSVCAPGVWRDQDCQLNTRFSGKIDSRVFTRLRSMSIFANKLGQLGFVAALSGFRAARRGYAFHPGARGMGTNGMGPRPLLFRQVTTLQPRSVLFWDMAAWHMAWNASVAAMNDPTQPRHGVARQGGAGIFRPRQGFPRARDRKTIPINPSFTKRWPGFTSRNITITSARRSITRKRRRCPARPAYDKRFSAYELSYCDGREREAYERLRRPL